MAGGVLGQHPGYVVSGSSNGELDGVYRWELLKRDGLVNVIDTNLAIVEALGNTSHKKNRFLLGIA